MWGCICRSNQFSLFENELVAMATSGTNDLGKSRDMQSSCAHSRLLCIYAIMSCENQLRQLIGMLRLIDKQKQEVWSNCKTVCHNWRVFWGELFVLKWHCMCNFLWSSIFVVRVYPSFSPHSHCSSSLLYRSQHPTQKHTSQWKHWLLSMLLYTFGLDISVACSNNANEIYYTLCDVIISISCIVSVVIITSIV